MSDNNINGPTFETSIYKVHDDITLTLQSPTRYTEVKFKTDDLIEFEIILIRKLFKRYYLQLSVQINGVETVIIDINKTPKSSLLSAELLSNEIMGALNNHLKLVKKY